MIHCPVIFVKIKMIILFPILQICRGLIHMVPYGFDGENIKLCCLVDIDGHCD